MIANIGQILLYSSFLVLFLTWVVNLFSKNQTALLTRGLVVGHLVSVLGVLGCLYYLIFTNQFQYYYVWHHTSLSTPFWFKVSCLWEGQEGSFLLWIVWNALLIVFLSLKNTAFIRNTLLFLIPVQLVLLSMILGVEFSTSQLTIGSSPFSLLKDNIQSEVYAINPNFVPSDGTGMNALLQNYWMVIHPPIIFLGFALSAIPFAMCMGALLKKETVGNWVKPAIPWVLAAVFFIGLGMIMGAYWAYETLNFGGYWNWDPVENAIYIPWLILVGVLHLMLIYTKKQKALKPLVLLTLSGFLLVVYSTFLTRSGILGESSVHSFTDLGLSNQLLIFLLGFVVVASIVYVRAISFFPKEEKSSVYSFEFWVFVGVLVLSLSAFQVLIPTSFPVINAVSKLVGFNIKLAPPADQVSYYTNIQLWFAVALMVMSVVGQFAYRRYRFSDKLIDVLFVPVVLTTLVVAVVLLFFGVEKWQYIIVLTVGVFAGIMNVKIFFLQKEMLQKSGGALAHVGLVLLILGVLFSQGYKKVLTETTQFQNEMNRSGNVLLVKEKSIAINEYAVTYENAFFKTATGSRIDKSSVEPTFTPGTLRATKPFFVDGRTYQVGDEIGLDVENSYYRVNFQSSSERFTIEPRIQYNTKMGVVASPDISRSVFSDVYTHVSNFPDPNQKPDWSKALALSLKKGDSVMIGSKVLLLHGIDKLNYEDENTLALKAHLSLKVDSAVYELKPVLLRTAEASKVIGDKIAGNGTQIVFHGFNPENNSYQFSYLGPPMDWITIKSIRFPMIKMVWLGALLMLLGMSLSFSYRLKLSVSISKIKITVPTRVTLRRSWIQFIKS